MKTKLDAGKRREEQDIKESRPWIYLFGAILWTWGFYGLAFLFGEALFSFPSVLFYAAGGLGPLAVSTILIGSGYWGSDSSLSEFLKRCLNPWSLSVRWYLIIIGLVTILTLIPWSFSSPQVLGRGPLDVGPPLFLLIGIIFGGLEEIGWRGYAQESLQSRLSVLNSSLVIGLFWAVWHLPLFFMEGTYQATLGAGSPAFWSFNFSIIIISPIYAWIFNSAGKAPFAAVIFHALSNVAGELTVDAPMIPDLVVPLVVSAFLIAVSWKWIKEPSPELEKKES